MSVSATSSQSLATDPPLAHHTIAVPLTGCTIHAIPRPQTTQRDFIPLPFSDSDYPTIRSRVGDAPRRSCCISAQPVHHAQDHTYFSSSAIMDIFSITLYRCECKIDGMYRVAADSLPSLPTTRVN